MNLLFFWHIYSRVLQKFPESGLFPASTTYSVLTYNNTPSTCSYTSKAFYHSRDIRTLPSAGESTCTSFTHTHAHPRPCQMHARCIGRTRAAMCTAVGVAVRGACIVWSRILPSIRACTLFTPCLYPCLHTCVQHHSTQEHVVSCAIPCMHCGWNTVGSSERSMHYMHTVCRTGPNLAMKGYLRYVVFDSPSSTRTHTHALHTVLFHQPSSHHPMLRVLCSHTQAL